MAYSQETKNIFVGPDLVECTGVGPQKCMMVRDAPKAKWQYFYDKISGFEFQPGYEYEL